jgi:chromate transporter
MPRAAFVGLFFAQLSFFAVGGANSVIPEMQRRFVDTPGWLDGTLFASLVAIAQAAPGPNAMVVGLVGWHAAGALGAIAATAGFTGPPAVLTLLVGRVWGRVRASGAGAIILEGVGPLTVGLVLAGGWALVEASGDGAPRLAVAITTLVGLVALARASAGTWLLLVGAAIAMLLG